MVRRSGNVFQFFQVKRVFLACPGDLVSERSRFPRLLETVNNLRAHSLGFHLTPVGWERVIPSFGRPQESINEELGTAELVVVIFWNRIGSPASNSESARSGTVEEFELARCSFARIGKPLVWVYFRKPTAEPNAQLQGVLDFRKTLEDGKDLFFREYGSLNQWEEMFREHLVGYLNGLQRWSLDRNFEQMCPDRALIHGNFLGEGICEYGSRLRFNIDLDGDGNEEQISFWYSHGGHSLTVVKFDKGFSLSVPTWIEEAETTHVAIKDITNDGLPEILIASVDGPASLRFGVWGFTASGRATRRLDENSFALLGEFQGQYHVYVREGGTFILPYGSAGFVSEYRWQDGNFQQID
ncbi:MAG: VCBS repeat-containing protein [Acidobacteria bacterium]|nr:VCBS repeat-containing protein [Acidobacteriota bacterium]